MKIAYLLGSVSRAGGGLFEICRRLAQNMTVHGATDVLGLRDQFTDLDIDSWCPLRPAVFRALPPRSFGYAPGYARYLQMLQPDLVHVHALWMYPTLCASRWHQTSRRPFMFTAHGMLDAWAIRNSRWKKRLLGFLWEDAAHQEAFCFQVNSEAEYRTGRAYGLRNPIAVIPNGMDLPDLSVKHAVSWNAQIGARKVLLYLGRLHPKKNLAALLEGWKAVQSAAPQSGDWVLVIAGWDQNNHKAKLRQQTRELGLEESVYFSGPVFGNEKAAAYQNAEAFVLPSFSEGLPMVVLEAWAYGKPVVMTAECNLPEGFAAGAALLTGTTKDALVESLGRLFEMSDEERKNMGGRGRALVSKRFLWPQIAEELKSVCEWAVGGGDPPACVHFN